MKINHIKLTVTDVIATEITIPALSCASLTETLNFYVAPGFEITYQQERPNH